MYAGTMFHLLTEFKHQLTVKADGSITPGQQETSTLYSQGTQIQKQCTRIRTFICNVHAENLGPPRTAGTVTLVHDFIDSYVQPRKAWQYSPATRRVRESA